MSKHPVEPYLFEVAVRNSGDPLVVRAGSLPEARNYIMENFVTVKKLSPSEAFRAGREGSEILNAKPEYAQFDDDLADAADDASSADPMVQHA